MSIQGQLGPTPRDAGNAVSEKGAFFQLSWLGAKDASAPVAAKNALPTLCEMPLGVGWGGGNSRVPTGPLAPHPGT